MFNEYPYVNLQDVNLDWILKHIKNLEINLQDFIKLNTIKYADPIDWNISKQYEANTVVVNELTGVAYLSTQPVPAGVDVTNTDYWTPIFTLDFVNMNKNITLRNDGNNNNATFASAIGDWLIVGGQLYKVIRNITLHTAYVVGYNIQVYSVEMFVRDYLNQVLNLIGDLDNLTSSDKTSVVNAINSVLSVINTKIGDLNELMTDDKTSIVNSINSLVTGQNTLVYSPDMFGAVGDGTTDDTTALQNMINAAITDKYSIYIPKEFNCKITSELEITTNYLTMVIDGQITADGCNGIKIDGLYNTISGSGFIEGDSTHTGILIGGVGKTTNCNYNKIYGVNIGHFDIGIDLYNDQVNSLTVYFNIMSNLSIYRCRIGIYLEGLANAEQISKIIFAHCGDGDNTGGAIVTHSLDASHFPLDNSVSQIFHHQSNNAITLNIDKINYSQFLGIVSEQGGSGAKSIVINDNSTHSNLFELTSNVSAFRTIPSECYPNNVFLDIRGSFSAGNIDANKSLLVGENITQKSGYNLDRMRAKHRYFASGIAENTNLVLFTFTTRQYPIPCALRVKALIGSSTYVNSLHGYVEGIVYLSNIAGSAPTVLQNLGNKNLVMDGNNVTVNVGNNGTSTARGQVYLELEFIFDNDNVTSSMQGSVGSAFTEI